MESKVYPRPLYFRRSATSLDSAGAGLIDTGPWAAGSTSPVATSVTVTEGAAGKCWVNSLRRNRNRLRLLSVVIAYCKVDSTREASHEAGSCECERDRNWRNKINLDTLLCLVSAGKHT